MDDELLAGETGPAIVLIDPERAGAVIDALVELTGYTREEWLAHPRPRLACHAGAVSRRAARGGGVQRLAR